MTTNLQDQLHQSREKHGVAGASYALYENGQLTTAVSGLANVTTGIEIDRNTVMHIGSITKVFNATLLMQFVDEGLVELDRPVLHYLPELRTADMDALSRVTVAMLVNHQSGMDGVILPDFGPDRERIADGIARCADLGQIHEPGTDVSYSNIAPMIGGYLCERLKNKSWYTLIEQQIFKPLGMDHAIAQPADALLHRASVGHYIDPATHKPYRTSFAFLPLSFAPAGATLMMSATDLVTFARMHLNDGVGPNGTRVLSAESARLMRVKTGTYSGPMKASFGLGWMLVDPGMFGHGGGGPGIMSFLIMDPASNAAIAVETNSAEGAPLLAEMTAPFLTSRGGQPLTPSMEQRTTFAAGTDEPVDGAPYVGTYEGIAVRYEVEQHGAGLRVKVASKITYYETMTTEAASAPLGPLGNGVFIVGEGLPGLTGRAVGFVNPDKKGRMQHIAPGGALYKRTG